jgi:hypothetical protein
MAGVVGAGARLCVGGLPLDERFTEVARMNSFFSLPLLGRELTERAARKRTYAGRVVYGLVLYTLFVFALRRLVGSAESDPTGFGVLGFGRSMFQQLVELQCWGVFLFQPALMAGVLTYEKERESFTLLLLTRMSPTKILIEKFLAGLFPMATLLLLALPLGAITMGYGGVSPQLLATGVCVVVAAWLAVGAFSLLCSAWFRSPVSAMLAAYPGGALVILLPAIGYSLRIRYVLWGADLRGLDVPDWLWSLWPPEVFARVMAFQEAAGATGDLDGSALWARLLAETARLCAPLLICAAVCLLVARVVMVRRAVSSGGRERLFQPPQAARAAVSSALKWIHSLWPKHAALPGDEPVAWRESGRGLLGRRGRFLYFTLLAAGLTFALSLFLLGLYPRTAGPERLHHLSIALGAIAILVLTVRSVGSLLSEHANQTLDILLSTPLGAAEILREKARALRRYSLLFGLILGVVFALEGWSEYQYLPGEVKWRLVGQYWICDALALLVYPPLIVWFAIFFALRLRARARAMIFALLFLALWLLGPRLILSFAWPSWRFGTPGFWLSLLSPLGILDANHSGRLEDFTLRVEGRSFSVAGVIGPWFLIAVNFGAYAIILAGVRSLCLLMAEKWMRRSG